MLINIDKTKVIIIKSKKVTHPDITYDHNHLEDINSYNYLEVNIHQKLDWKYNVEKRINGVGKLILVLRIIVKKHISGSKRGKNASLIALLNSNYPIWM